MLTNPDLQFKDEQVDPEEVDQYRKKCLENVDDYLNRNSRFSNVVQVAKLNPKS